jgi:Fur family ferric uptake transcriptional regulator
MTSAGQSPSVLATESQVGNMERRTLFAELVAKGVRMTVQRRAVVEAIQQAREHLDAGSLLERARVVEPNIDRATVYRTLDLLKKLGLIDELDLMHMQGEKHYFEVKTKRDHIHLACFRCGRVEEYSSPLFERLQTEISTDTSFTIKTSRLEIGGTCRICSATNRQPGEQEEKE